MKILNKIDSYLAEGFKVYYDGPHLKNQETTVKIGPNASVKDVIAFMNKNYKDVDVKKVEKDGKVVFSKGKK